MKYIVDATTGVTTVRDLNAEELAQQAIDIANAQASAEVDSVNPSKDSAIAKLAALGLTEDEIGEIIGKNERYP